MSTGIIEAFNKSTFLVQMNLLLSVAQTLASEINSGERYSSKISPMLQARELCGTPRRTKRGVLIDYVAWMQTLLTDYQPDPSVVKAMQKPASRLAK